MAGKNAAIRDLIFRPPAILRQIRGSRGTRLSITCGMGESRYRANGSWLQTTNSQALIAVWIGPGTYKNMETSRERG